MKKELTWKEQMEHSQYVDTLMNYDSPRKDTKIGTFEELKEALLYKRVIEWSNDHLLMDDGTKVTIETMAYDCCAGAGGQFENIKLDAAITDVVLEKPTFHGSYYESEEDYEEYESRVILKLYHNQNEFAQADVYADAGSGGFYYSIAALLVKDVFYPLVNSGEAEEDNNSQ